MQGIKFMVWDANNKCWLPNDDANVAITDDGKILLQAGSSGDWVKVSDDNYIIVRYTGLTDKYGEEIYEGDIVNFHTPKPTHWMQEIDMITRNTIKEVVWKEGKFHLNKNGDVLNWHATSKASDLEVIGNIYETPELLK